MPHGRVVGGPYSSWLKKLPSRPVACITKIPGATMSAQRQTETRWRRARTSTAIAPVTKPPKMPEPAVRRQEDLDRVGGVELPLVDDVVQPAADERGDRDDDQRVADDVAWARRSGAPAGP